MANKSSDEEVLTREYKKALNSKVIEEDLMFYVTRCSFNSNPHATSFNEGQRDLALRILQMAEKL